ncbi:hypothetical protein BCR32DRAFT_196871, partial [Anaeromyces robustus]
CFATKLNYKCCSGCDVAFVDNDGKWGYENNNWCGLKDTCDKTEPQPEPQPEPTDECFSIKLGYPCCNTCNVSTTDQDGSWGIENNQWCGIKDSC